MTAEDAVREYREQPVFNMHHPMRFNGERFEVMEKTYADAAIAELEAENKRLQVGWNCAELAVFLKDGLKRQAEAEVAALKARRCGTCRWWRETAPTFHPGRMDCDHYPPMSVGDTIPPADFACNRWAEYEEMKR